MAAMLETPSRIWRRIEAVEDRDMPSLPSLPLFEDSVDADTVHHDYDDQFQEDLESISSRIHSTPPSAHHTITSTARHPSSTSSTARFAHSLASRSSKSSVALSNSSSRGMSTRRGQHNSFEVPSLPIIEPSNITGHYQVLDEEESKSTVPDVYLPPPDEELDRKSDLSITDALESVSRASSPPFSPEVKERQETPKKNYDYSISLKSEPKGSPFEKYRNVALRRTNPHARTPSLSRTSSSRTSSPTHSTPQSNVLSLSNAASPISAMPLPRSTSASPAIVVRRPEDDDAPSQEHDETHETGLRSMEITDIHISPPRTEGDNDIYGECDDQEQDSRNNEEREDASHYEREPTFSSDGDATPYPSANRSMRQNTNPFSSPAQSEAFTPTPAFPRSRARFDLPPPPGDLLTTPAPKSQEEHADPNSEEDEDPLTPHTRRRSFLLDVINSTARPRMKFPTPHPRKFDTPSITESTPGPGASSGGTSSPGPSLQSAFVGVTQRPRMGPRRRMSHPLSQTISASSHGTSESASPISGGNSVPWATPAHASPYDGTADRASFISTASSHDLTTHHRVNTSFDPAMGFGAGAPGHGVGRFNAAKLNNYLHGLNRRLQEENENLTGRLKTFEDLKKEDGAGDAVEPNRRLSVVSRRASSVRTSLGNVQEDVAEGWLEEKAELEDMVEEFKTELTTCMAEKEEVERALEQEKEGRERDKERWRDRMTEVEQGVSGIIAGLEQKLQAAEKQTKKAEKEASQQVKEIAKELVEIRGDRDVAMERASKAERVLESGKDLGGALKEANERVAQVMSDLRNANAQIKELEEEVMRSDGRIDDLEKDQREDKDIIAGLEEELSSRSDALAADRAEMKQLEDTIRKLDDELTSTKAYMDEMGDNAVKTYEGIRKVEGELVSAQATIRFMSTAEKQASTASKALEEEADNARELARQMEDALGEAEKKMLHDEELVAELQSKIATLERERQRQVDVSRAPVEAGPTEAELQAVENELDDANREIARLTTLLSQSPARKAMEKARDTRIEMLEREKDELLERNRALKMTFNDINTPNKLVNTSGISPIHRQVLSMSIRAPKTPGGPLRDISWLNNSPSDPSVSPLVAEIHRLQGELDRANESIDDKLDKLEDAGLGVVGLTKKLEDARSKVVSLEDEIARLTRREARRMRRLARARCQKCSIKLDLRYLIQPDESSMDIVPDQLPHEPPTPPTRTSEALKASLQSVNNHLDGLRNQWEKEKKRLLGEKVILEDAANRLNGQLKGSKE